MNKKELGYKILKPAIIIKRVVGFFFHPISSLRYLKQYLLIRQFGNFDPDFYISQVEDDKIHKFNALHHYILYGKKAGYKPEKEIEDNYINHLFLKKNQFLTIKKSRMFKAAYYRQHCNIQGSFRQLVLHYITTGWKSGCNPNNKFDTEYYLENHPDVQSSDMHPFIHYLQFGIYELRQCNETVTNTRLERGLSYFKVHGIRKAFLKLLKKSNKARHYKLKHWMDLYNISSREHEVQKAHKFHNNPLISILVPAYNPKPAFLKDLTESVIKQTYGNWELIIADGSTEKVTYQYFVNQNDYRIKYKRLEKNQGIAGNTNEAYAMSTGEYVLLLDHDDFLSEDALYEVVKAINENNRPDFIFSDRAVTDEKKQKIIGLHFLPGYSPDLLRSYNYASHLNAFSKRIIEQVGFEKSDFDGAQDYDLELRVVEQTDKIVHIPRILYYCRAHSESVSGGGLAKPYAYEAGKKALEEHTKRIGYPAKVTFLQDTLSYKISYEIKYSPSVAIIIPNKDYKDGLKRCVESILNRSTYKNYKIYIIENNSEEQDTFSAYAELSLNAKTEVLYYPHKGFNYSGVNNWAVKDIKEEYLVLLNNDTEVITPNWIEEMLMHAQRDSVGAVGCMLYYPDDKIQHCGLEIGLNGWVASHFEHRNARGSNGYLNRLRHVQNFNGLTAACLMVSKSDYVKVGGMDEINLKVALNDMDFCLKLVEQGKYNVLTPHAELYHFEGITRGYDLSKKNKERFTRESEYFKKKWDSYFIKPDRYSNRNLSKYIY